jgi:hypothetical protein
MENERDGKALEEGMVRMDIYVSIILLISSASNPRRRNVCSGKYILRGYLRHVTQISISQSIPAINSLDW